MKLKGLNKNTFNVFVFRAKSNQDQNLSQQNYIEENKQRIWPQNVGREATLIPNLVKPKTKVALSIRSERIQIP